MQLEEGRAQVSSQSPEFGEAREEIPVEYKGPALQICFNAQYVLDFLSVVETDSIALDLKDEVSQAVMRPLGASDYDYTYVVMPMRI
jgi:DNA polymerase-3 subunit beta